MVVTYRIPPRGIEAVKTCGFFRAIGLYQPRGTIPRSFRHFDLHSLLGDEEEEEEGSDPGRDGDSNTSLSPPMPSLDSMETIPSEISHSTWIPSLSDIPTIPSEVSLLPTSDNFVRSPTSSTRATVESADHLRAIRIRQSILQIGPTSVQPQPLRVCFSPETNFENRREAEEQETFGLEIPVSTWRHVLRTTGCLWPASTEAAGGVEDRGEGGMEQAEAQDSGVSTASERADEIAQEATVGEADASPEAISPSSSSSSLEYLEYVEADTIVSASNDEIEQSPEASSASGSTALSDLLPFDAAPLPVDLGPSISTLSNTGRSPNEVPPTSFMVRTRSRREFLAEQSDDTSDDSSIPQTPDVVPSLSFSDYDQPNGYKAVVSIKRTDSNRTLLIAIDDLDEILAEEVGGDEDGEDSAGDGDVGPGVSEDEGEDVEEGEFAEHGNDGDGVERECEWPRSRRPRLCWRWPGPRPRP